MQLDVTLMIVYKCGAEDTGESPLLPHTVGYVHSEYLSCTTPPQGFTAQEVSLGTTHNHVVPFAYFFKSSTIDLLSIVLRMNDKKVLPSDKTGGGRLRAMFVSVQEIFYG